MEDLVFNVALVGYGLSAKVFQIPFIPLIPQFKLHAIVHRHPKPNDDAEKDNPGVRLYRTTGEMLKDSAVHLVVIGTASDTHFKVCKEALEAGKHVLCEKPFTMTTAEADQLISLAANRQLILTVFHNRRWDSDFQTLRYLIGTGKLGRIVEFETHFDTHSPVARPGWETTWRTQSGTGSGVLYDLGSHLIDQVLVLFGKPQKVSSFLYHQRPEHAKYGDPDSMTILMHYLDGMLVTIKSSVMNAEKEQLRYWVRGEKGVYKKYHLDIQESQIVNGHMPGSSGFGVEPTNHHGTLSSLDESGEIISQTLPTVAPPTYLVLYQQLADALSGRGSVPVTARSARDVIQIIELALKSAELEKTIYL